MPRKPKGAKKAKDYKEPIGPKPRVHGKTYHGPGGAPNNSPQAAPEVAAKPTVNAPQKVEVNADFIGPLRPGVDRAPAPPPTKGPPVAEKSPRAMPPRQRRAAPSKPVKVKRGRPVGAKNKVFKPVADKFVTYFRAKGKIGFIDTPTFLASKGLEPGTPEAGRAVRLAYVGAGLETPPGFESGPVAFFSNNYVPVKQDGIHSLSDRIERLNRGLNIRTKRGRLADFREVYREWSFKYQVVRSTDEGKRGKFGEVIRKDRIIDKVSKAGRNNVGRFPKKARKGRRKK